MVALILQTLTTGLAIAGVWLWDIPIGAKLLLLGTLGSLFVFLQYQHIETMVKLVQQVALLETRVRVIQKSIELKQDLKEGKSPEKVVLEEMASESRSQQFAERLTPNWWIDLMALVAGVALASLVGWVIVLLVRQNAAQM